MVRHFSILKMNSKFLNCTESVLKFAIIVQVTEINIDIFIQFCAEFVLKDLQKP